MNVQQTTLQNSYIIRDSGCYPSMEGLQHGEWNHIETIVISRGPELTCSSISQTGTQTTFTQPAPSPKPILKHKDPSWLNEGVVTGGSRSLPASPSRTRHHVSRVATGSPLAARSTSLSPHKTQPYISSVHISPIRTPSPIVSSPLLKSPSYSSSSVAEPRRVPWQPPPGPAHFKPCAPERSSSLTNNLTPVSGSTVAHLASDTPWPLMKDYAREHLDMDNMNNRTMSSPNINLNTPPSSPAHRVQASEGSTMSQRVSRHESLLSRQKPRQVSVTLDTMIINKLESEDIDLTSQPYTDKVSFVRTASCLLIRYAA